MQLTEEILNVKDELASAMAEEAEALRRANRLRTTGAAPDRLREALKDVDREHSRVALLQHRLKHGWE